MKWPERQAGQKSKGRRRGDVFSVRVTASERERLEAMQQRGGGPRALGPWLLWRALDGEAKAPEPEASYQLPLLEQVVPPVKTASAGEVVPDVSGRLILDLCGGSGSWSEPYRAAGYPVEVVTLPEGDVRTYTPRAPVWGILAAPPCTEFSIAKNGQARDFVKGMETVNACLRIVLQARPRWWALENPTGLLGDYLGTARDVFEPCDFGDPWTKRTALWGDFVLPKRGPFVKPTGSAMDRSTPAERAITPAGFARAFFEANP